MKKILRRLIPLGLLVTFGYLLFVSFTSQSDQSSTPVNPSLTTSPAPTAPTTTLPPADSPRNNKAARQAVDMAATATSLLSSAVLLPSDQMSQFVNQLVAPGQRKSYLQVATVTGPKLATFMGYGSIAEANSAASYDVETQKYRVETLTNTKAKVYLYIVTHWVTATGEEYQVPNITIVNLQKVGHRWYYVNTSTPSAEQTPQPIDGLTYEQTALRFQSYLKGYQDYVPGTDNP